MGIEGAPEPDLARLSRALGDTLRATGRFALVANGAEDIGAEERDLLFRYRYALTDAALDGPALRRGMTALLEGLRSAASPILARYGFADPSGAFLSLLNGWLGGSTVQVRGGAWFAAGNGPPRALLVARTNAAGFDVEAQAEAVQAVRDAYAAASPGPARLLLSGPGVFASSAAAAVQADVQRVSLLSGVLLLAFLLWRYRSPTLLLAAGVPLVAGIIAGTLAVALVFGRVQGAALGFGITMLGVVVDYPILLLTGRRPGETTAEAARRIWPSLRLAAGAAALGLTAMVASGFPGLAQLGLFGAAGLAAGAAVTRWVLPALLPAGGAVRPLPRWITAGLEGVRPLPLAALALAVGWLLLAGPPRWEDDLANLSPVPEAPRRLDAELRGQLGAPDARYLVALRAPTAEAVLVASERLAGALAPLLADGRLARLDHPARYLPSAAAQAARAAALPEAAALRTRVEEARAGLPFRPGAFDPVLAAVEEARTLPPLTVEDLSRAPVLAARLSPLLARTEAGWRGLALLSGPRDPAEVAATLSALGDRAILFVDAKGETEAMVAATTRGALAWCAVGGAGVFGLLALGLHSPWRAARTVLPILGALIIALAGLAVLGERLTPFHLAALLLTAGVGMDYAIFLATRPAEPEEAERTLGAVFNCTVTTLLTFGLLATCETPVLRGIGVTVTIGVAAAFLLAVALRSRKA
ncbi:MMPL family transporter [Roseomonas sp. CCTCC AB2023176]|uniref:MMPL family transporter n=1 Tax=Roseomonas sp. CCTCC AB2023176 TaxID=3342640 RepID=UPI0035E05B76